jgi:anti-anti-sigma regulatory factor
MVVVMTIIPVLLNIGEKCVVPALQEAAEKLNSAEGEAVLDFSSVGRIDSNALRAMEEFVAVADAKGVKVVLCGVSVGVYKVLKLAKLAPRFSFNSSVRLAP